MDTTYLIDPQRKHVQIGVGDVLPPDYSDQDGWRALGECIGSHEHLQELIFDGIQTTHENLEALLTGVNQNRTVMELIFRDCRGEWPLGILAMFFQSNQNLSVLVVGNCCESIITSLSAALRGCTSRSLERIACIETPGVDEIAELIEALAGLPQLKRMEINMCNIGLRGCDAVASLLQSPACVLQRIYLDNNGVNDESLAVLEHAVAVSSTLTELSLDRMECSTTALQSFAGILRSPTCMLKKLFLLQNKIRDDEIIVFADALTTNRRLEYLMLDDDHLISDIGFAAMTRALCNTSSIGDVHSSNHVLKRLLGLSKKPTDLRNYLRMNENEDKSLVAREKIFIHFFKGDFSMEPFHENAMAPNILPHLLSWIGRTPDGESFTALFNFLRRMPSLCGNCCPALKHRGMKLKAGN